MHFHKALEKNVASGELSTTVITNVTQRHVSMRTTLPPGLGRLTIISNATNPTAYAVAKFLGGRSYIMAHIVDINDNIVRYVGEFNFAKGYASREREHFEDVLVEAGEKLQLRVLGANIDDFYRFLITWRYKKYESG